MMALHTCALLGVAEARVPFDATEIVSSTSSWRHRTTATLEGPAAAGDNPEVTRRDGGDNHDGLAKAAPSLSEPNSNNKIDQWSNRRIGKPISIRNFRDREVLLTTSSFVSNFTITTSLHMPPGSSTGLLRIVAIDLETADKYLARLGDDFFAHAPIQNSNAMYAFLEKALIASKPGPVDEQYGPKSHANAVPCGLWTVVDDSSQTPTLHIQAVMTYDHEWLEPLRVLLDVPRVQKASPEDKFTLEMQKMREGFEARLAEAESQMRTAVDEMKTSLMRNSDSAGKSRAEVEELRSAVDVLRLQANNVITIRGYAISIDSTSLTNNLGTLESVAYLDTRKHGTALCPGGDYRGTISATNSRVSTLWCTAAVTSAPSWYPAYSDNGRPVEHMPGTISQILPSNMTQEELRSLSLCKNLTHLTIHNSPGITDLSPLGTLVALKKLDFTGCSGLTEVEVLNSLPNLEEVILTNSGVKNKHFLTNPRLKVVGAG